MKKTTNKKALKVKQLTNRVKGLDIKGQGCKNDCAEGYWSGSANDRTPGCDYTSTANTAKGSTLF